jgi:hypothetical protein
LIYFGCALGFCWWLLRRDDEFLPAVPQPVSVAA